MFPTPACSVEVTHPTALDQAEDVVIDEGAFHFSALIISDTDDLVEWESSLLFSEIAELRFRPSNGLVLGALRDGSELRFRFDAGIWEREAMQVVEALFGTGPEAGRLLHLASPSMSDEELVAVLQTLEGAFEDAAQCGCESQVKRFARLTAAADFEVEWIERVHRLEAKWRRTGKMIFAVEWEPEARFTVLLGTDRGSDPHGGGGTTWLRTGDAFGVHDDREVMHALGTETYGTSMDAAETDDFLDALEAFLTSHSLPSREAEADWERKERSFGRGCGVLTLAILSIFWVSAVLIALTRIAGKDSLSDRWPLFVAGILLSLTVPVLAIVNGVAARREIRESGSGRSGIALAWGAIILGTIAVLVVAAWARQILQRPQRCVSRCIDESCGVGGGTSWPCFCCAWCNLAHAACLWACSSK